MAGADDARPALYGGFGPGNFLALDGVDSKGEEASEGLASGTDTDVCLHESSITRKIKNGIVGKVVRLKLVEIQKLAEKVRGREAEAALEVSEKDNKLTGFKYRLDLVAWKPAGYSFRYPSRPV
jgi:hypothetical protein